MARRKLSFIMLAALCFGAATSKSNAQEPEPTETSPGIITLHFPENVDLKVLIEYVGKRYGLSFIYDEQVGTRKITIRGAQQIPADSLMVLLESALKMKGLVLSPTKITGVMKIEMAAQLATMSSGPGPQAEGASPALAVTRVFQLKHVSAFRAERLLSPFLSVPSANLTTLPDLNILVVTDYSDNLKKLEDLISLIDRTDSEVVVKLMPLVNMEAATAAQKLTQLLAGKAKASGGDKAGDASASISVLADERTNQLAMVGSASDVNQAIEMLNMLDLPLGVETKVYTFSVIAAEQLDSLAKSLIGEADSKRLYKSTIDRASNLLVVTTTPAFHQQIDALRKAMDIPVADGQSPIRFHKLENAKAADVLVTLQSISGDGGLDDASVEGTSGGQGRLKEIVYEGPTEADINQTVPQYDSQMPRLSRPQTSVSLRDARIMADEPSNTIIVMAKPSMHPVYEKLIQQLDRKRPQVLVTATVVVIDTTNNFTLGVEFYAKNESGGGDLLNFTKFGLATKESLPGSVTLSPGTGYNGALLNTDVAEVVIRALESDSRAKVVSRPTVLINDNATGTLASEREEPFATVTASGVAGATTSLGGFASAGTSIIVTPQISAAEHLKLKYKITLSAFDGTGSNSLPPSREKNSLESEATIPDGYTIVVGGLTRDTFRESVDRIPILGSIPGVEYLFSSRTSDKRQSTLYVFIKAVILRDDKFADLKNLSGTAAGEAELAGDGPKSEPVEMR